MRRKHRIFFAFKQFVTRKWTFGTFLFVKGAHKIFKFLGTTSKMPLAIKLTRSKFYTKAPYFYADVSTSLIPGAFCSAHVRWYSDTLFLYVNYELQYLRWSNYVPLYKMFSMLYGTLNYRPIFDKTFYCIVSVFLTLLWNMLIHCEGQNKEKPLT